MTSKAREHELMTELRAARLDLAAAAAAEEEARRAVVAERRRSVARQDFLEKKAARRFVEKRIEQVLDEITTGKRADPLIEYAESRAETADERQRGPTADVAKSRAAPRDAGFRESKIVGDPSEFARELAPAVDMCELHEGSWRDTKVRDVIVGADVRDALKKHGVVTLGHLADAGSDLGLWDALHPWCSTVEIASIEHDLAKWLRKYPKGFPADLVEELSAVLAAPASPPPATTPPPKADWGTPCHMTVALRLPSGADYIHATYTPAKEGTYGLDHLEFKGPVSQTGYRSHFFDRPDGWHGDLASFVDRLARHLARLDGKDAAEEDDAPAWRSKSLNEVRWDVRSGFGEKLVKTLQKGRLLTLGDLADAVDLDCHLCREVRGATVISGPSWKAAVEALDAYRDKLTADARKAEASTSPPPAPDDDDQGDEFEPAYASEDDVMDALHDSIFPAEDDAPAGWKGWKPYRDSGFASDRDVLDELAAIWPSKVTFVDRVGGEGYTVRGGPSPAFWHGMLGSGKLPVADLEGGALAIAVRSLLRIPEPAGAPDLPGKPAVKPVAKLRDAVEKAYSYLSPAVRAKLEAGATDEEIGHALSSLPTHREEPTPGAGEPWACAGGDDPALWYGVDARTWPDRRHATLGFEKLIGAVRMAGVIPYPAGDPKPKSKPRKAKTAAAG